MLRCDSNVHRDRHPFKCRTVLGSDFGHHRWRIGGSVEWFTNQHHRSSAGLTLIIGSQLAILGSFESLLLAVALAGFFQILFGILRLGWLAYFFPSSVLQALLAAIGAILILKQIPHLLGHDTDRKGTCLFFSRIEIRPSPNWEL